MSTYGGDLSSRSVSAFGSGDGPGRDVKFGTVRAFGSDCGPGGRPMEGIPVPEPLEHSVLEMALDGGPLEEISDLEPIEHSVLNVALDGRPMEGIPVLEPLEHSVLEMALDGGPLEEMSDLEPIEHSVLNVALDGRPMEGIPVLEPLEHSVLEMALDSGLMEGDLSVAGIAKLDPIKHSGVAKRTETISAYLRRVAGRHVMIEQSRTVPTVTSGSALRHSATYVEYYNFYAPEGMDLMVHYHRLDPDSWDVRQNWQTDMTPVCQTMSCVKWDEWDMLDDDSLTEAFTADGPNMDEFYQRVVSSDEEDFVESDDGSVTDLDMDTSPFRMRWVHFRRKRLISGRRLCSGTTYFKGRS